MGEGLRIGQDLLDAYTLCEAFRTVRTGNDLVANPFPKLNVTTGVVGLAELA